MEHGYHPDSSIVSGVNKVELTGIHAEVHANDISGKTVTLTYSYMDGTVDINRNLNYGKEK